MTLVVEKGELVVARIIHGGMIDRQGKQIKEISIYQVGLGELLHSLCFPTGGSLKKGDLVEIVSILKTGSWLEYNSLIFLPNCHSG